MVLSTVHVRNAEGLTVTLTRTFKTSITDGNLENWGYNDYAGAWSAASAATVYDTNNTFQIGQYRTGTVPEYYYMIERAFLYFDTSAIPDGANITAAYLYFFISANYSTTDFNVTIQNGQPNWPNQPMVLSDYSKSHYRTFIDYEPWWIETNGGSRNTSEIVYLDWWAVQLNSEGLTWIDVDGTTKLCLRSSRDIGADQPSGSEFITVLSAEQGSAYAPTLYVTYETEGYCYKVHGPYYEDGSVANCITNVTMYSKTNNTLPFILNGTDGVADDVTIYNDNLGWYFQWNATATQFRSYFVSSVVFEEIYVYVCDPLKTYGRYTVNFLDLAGVLKAMPYVKVQRYIDGYRTIEKHKVDLENKVTFYLEAYGTYTIVLEDTFTSYTFGDLTFGADTAISLTVRAVDFPKQTLFTYKYVRIYADRTFGLPYGTITVTYQDTLNATTNVHVDINYKNGTNIYSWDSFFGTYSFVLSWPYALNSTDYSISCTIYHETYGTYVWRQYLPRTFSFAPWGMYWFGTLPFDSSVLIPAIIILCAGGLFSVINVYAGAIAMTVVASVLAYMGWIAISGAVLVVAFTLAVMLAIVYAKRRIQT